MRNLPIGVPLTSSHILRLPATDQLMSLLTIEAFGVTLLFLHQNHYLIHPKFWDFVIRKPSVYRLPADAKFFGYPVL